MAYKDSPNKQLAAGIGAIASAINPITGMPASANMGNMPPQPSNTMGNANPVFNNPAMAAAQGVFGSTQMRQNSVTPFQQNIIGEQTYEFQKDKPSGNYVAGLSLDIDKSADPSDTADRLVITPEQKKKMETGGVMTSKFIEQFEGMNIKKDSTSGGKDFYSINKFHNKK
tara:strand:- start:70 stop:579 length:510 start_codon:yes stop_codon:yes gene_type:complete